MLDKRLQGIDLQQVAEWQIPGALSSQCRPSLPCRSLPRLPSSHSVLPSPADAEASEASIVYSALCRVYGLGFRPVSKDLYF